MPGPCVGESSPWACRMAIDGTDAERAWARLASGEAPPPEPDHVAGAGEMVPTPDRVPLSDSLRARRLGGRNCPHGRAPTCGCSGSAWCRLMKRDVTLRDCLECLTTGARAGEGR